MPQVSGRCVDASGTPVPGVYVYAVPATGARFGKAPGTHSRRDGRWRLTLPPGEWTVRETGHAAYELVVGDTAVTTEPQPAATPAVAAGSEGLRRHLERRRSRRVPLPEPQPESTSPPTTAEPHLLFGGLADDRGAATPAKDEIRRLLARRRARTKEG